MKGSKIPRIELNTVHLFQHYSLFMPNKLQYNWHGYYCECVRPAQLPILTEVWAPSLLEQYPRYVPHQDCTGYNTYIDHCNYNITPPVFIGWIRKISYLNSICSCLRSKFLAEIQHWRNYILWPYFTLKYVSYMHFLLIVNMMC